MDLPILTSTKGTRVVKCSQLHRALGLNDQHYAHNAKQWLAEVYLFSDGIRRPAALTDYARVKTSPEVLHKDYYLSLELARLIALATRAKHKEAVANKLWQEEKAFPQQLRLSGAEALQLLEQVKALSRLTCLDAVEKRHLATYARRQGSADYWNHYRAEMIGYKKETLLQELAARGLSVSKRQPLRELLLRHKPLELIRVGLIDLYAAQGHPLGYAQEIAQIGYELALQLRLDIVDDRQGEALFAPPVDAQLLAGIRGTVAA